MVIRRLGNCSLLPPRYDPEDMAPLATPMSRTQSINSSKAWSNLASLEVLIVT